MSFILGAIKIIVLLGTLITIHELGHFLVARLFKVKVLKFSIGFGPKIFYKMGKETEFTLRLIPFGGFVQLEGEEKRSDDEAAFNNKPIWQRILIVAAGAVVNIVFALIIYFVISSSQGIYQSSIVSRIEPDSTLYQCGLRNGDEILKVNNKEAIFGWLVNDIVASSKTDDFTFEIKRNNEKLKINCIIPESKKGYLGVGFLNDKTVSYIQEDMPVSSSLLKIDDVVLAVNSVTVSDANEIVELIRNLPDQEIIITVLRDNDMVIDITTKTLSETRRFLDLDFAIVEPSTFGSFKYALSDLRWYIKANFEAYGRLFTGNTENVKLMGVVGIANEITKTSAVEEFFYLMCAISFSLGIFNLLPIPALDGGRILILIIESIRRKPLSEKVEQYIILAGFIIIILFAIVVTVFDVSSLF